MKPKQQKVPAVLDPAQEMEARRLAGDMAMKELEKYRVRIKDLERELVNRNQIIDQLEASVQRHRISEENNLIDIKQLQTQLLELEHVIVYQTRKLYAYERFTVSGCCPSKM